MASTRKLQTKDGKIFYEISVSRGRGKSRPSTRWYPPEGWSRKSIDRELAKVAAEYERQVKAGEVCTRSERKKKELEALSEAAKIFTLKQYCESMYMPSKTITISEYSRASFQTYLNNRIYPALGNLKMPDITSLNISAFLLSVQSEGKSHATVIKCYTILKSLFKMAYMNDVIERNPMDKVERPKPRKNEIKETIPEAYTADELRHIFSCLKNEPLKWRTFVWLLVDTGMRRGECCGLTWAKIDFDNCTIMIDRNLFYTPQKGIYIDTPKNGKSRIVDVDPVIIQMLRQMRLEQSKHIISQYVFTQDGSSEPMHPQSPTRYLTRFSKKYGIQGLHPHKLRHSFASVAITNGADIASVSEKLGHSDKAVTLRMYTHANQTSIKRAGDIFRQALQNPVTGSVPVFEEITVKKAT